MERGNERANIERFRAWDVERTARRLQRIQDRLQEIGLIDPALCKFCMDAEYIDHVEGRVFADRTLYYVTEGLTTLRSFPPDKRSWVIGECLSALAEKDCYANSAIRAVFSHPYRAWHIIGGCHWERTTGKKLMQMLQN